MNNSEKRITSNLQTRTVLVLQGEKSFWFKIVNAQIVDGYSEHISDEGDDCQLLCPWLQENDASSSCLVELILDTTLDEVDRVGIEVSKSSVINGYRRFLTVARLHKDYAQATIYELSGLRQNNVASMMHHAIPERWSMWLLQLQKRLIVFHRVTTGSQLAAHWSRRWTENKLLVMHVAQYERHLLVQRGAVLFLRTVPTVSRDENTTSGSAEPVQSLIDQSIEYLRSNDSLNIESVAVVKPYSFALPAASELAVQEENSYCPVNGPDSTEKSCRTLDKGSTYILVSMLLEQAFELDPDPDPDPDPDLKDTDVLCDAAKLPEVMQPGHRMLADSIRLRCKLWYGRPHSSSRHASEKKWLLRCSALRKLSALEPSLQYVNSAYRLVLVRRVSIIFVFIAAISLCTALLSGLAGNRLIQSNQIQQAAIKTAESDIYSRAGSVFSQPRITADSLFIADSLSGLSFSKPEKLLEDIATAVTRVAGVELDQLVWSLMESDEPYETLTHSINSVPYRKSTNLIASNETVQLELSGRVSGNTLNQQQKLLDDFVSQLLTVPNAIEARALESPINTALSSKSSVDSLGRYRVLLILGER